MASGWKHGREQNQRDPRREGPPQFDDGVNSGGSVRPLDADGYLSDPCDSAQPRHQLLPLQRGKVMLEYEDSGPSRQLSNSAPKLIPKPRLHDQPFGEHAGLAVSHRSSYSAAMSPAQRLQSIRSNIAKAAKLARREAADITLIAVSKTRSPGEIEALIEAGQRDFGESRVQEALEKWPPLLARHPDLKLHCIGRLQSNKAAEAVRLFDTIQSLDRPSLLNALIKEAEKAGRFPSVYVQVNIGDEPQKGGCAIGEVGELVATVRSSPLSLAGLMAIPPLGLEPSPFFALLGKIARSHDVNDISMGMSADYETAVMLGATAVRVGTALFEA